MHRTYLGQKRVTGKRTGNVRNQRDSASSVKRRGQVHAECFAQHDAPPLIAGGLQQATARVGCRQIYHRLKVLLHTIIRRLKASHLCGCRMSGVMFVHTRTPTPTSSFFVDGFHSA